MFICVLTPDPLIPNLVYRHGELNDIARLALLCIGHWTI